MIVHAQPVDISQEHCREPHVVSARHVHALSGDYLRITQVGPTRGGCLTIA